MDFRTVGKRLSNWGRWGADDRVGTLNHITPDRVAAAGRCIRSGRIVSLGLPIGAPGIQHTMGGRANPIHLMSMIPSDFKHRSDGMCCSDDTITMPLQSVTQWDGLAHIGYDDMLYNDIPGDSVTSYGGSSQLSIAQIAARGIAGRGVLLDIARLRGFEMLEAGDAITPADLDAAEAAQGVTCGAGDIVIVRTGWLRAFTVHDDKARYWNGEPGLSLDCASWLHERDIAAVASDNWGVEAIAPSDGRADDAPFPLHCVLIRDMGMTLGEIFVLDELADICATERRWDFFFTAPPLMVVAGVGSPITPLAIF